MEKILIGLLLSDKPLSLKKGIALQISNAAKSQTINYDGYNKMVNDCFDNIFSSTGSLDFESKEILTNVLKAWIVNNEKYSYKYIDEYIFYKSYDGPSSERVKELKKLSFFMNLLVKPKQKFPFQNLNNLQKFCYAALVAVGKIEELNMICGIFMKYPLLMPKQLPKESTQNVIKIFVKVLADTPISKLIDFETKQNKNEQYIFDFLTNLNEKDESISKIIAYEIFNILTKEGTHPSISVAKFLKYLNLEGLSVYITDFKISDDLLTLMTSRLTDWICLPDSTIPVEQWPLQLLKFLIQQEKYKIMFSIVEGKIKQVFHLVFIPVFRARALSLATFMLISYLHSPKPFHQISSLIPKLFTQLKDENTESAQQALKVMAELTFTLMYHYPGYPDIYEHLLVSLKGFSMPSETSMKLWLKASLNIAPADMPDFIVPERLPDTKVGLDNLGNTCYANSVIQALFNMKRVKKLLLENVTQTQGTTKALQELFVLLGYSKRSSVKPKVFLNLSRPPWFQAGFQQDCSEYLKYLLDKLQSECIENEDDINSFVSGKMRTSVECLNCGFVSAREELFNDIPLSFNLDNPTPTESVDQTLKGGDSSDRLKRKIDCKLSQSGDSKQTITDDVIESMTSQLHDVPNISVQYSIQDMFCSYLKPEILKDSNKYHCENCSDLQNATKKIEIIEFPHYLVLTMKRFTYNVATQKRSKLLHVVQHPHTFTICSTCARCHQEDQDLLTENASGSSSRNESEKSICCIRSNFINFRLLSVIVHSGHSSDSGHYYAYTCDYNSNGGVKWRLMNDSRVSDVPSDCISKLSSRFPSDTPYVCIYEKFDPDEEIEEINVQATLLDYLNADNSAYEKELQRDAFRRRKNTFSPIYDTDKDNDDGGDGGGGPCGGGGGGLHASGRFVF